MTGPNESDDNRGPRLGTWSRDSGVRRQKPDRLHEFAPAWLDLGKGTDDHSVASRARHQRHRPPWHRRLCVSVRAAVD